MPVNLMQGKLDGDDGNKNEKKSNSIDLTLEKKLTNKPDINSPEKHPQVKEIKVKVPSDIKLDNSESSGGSLKIVAGIVMLLMVSTGVLLFLLNSESQDLRGSVNVLPETNSAQIVDDILAEDFSNQANQNATETEQVQVEEGTTNSTVPEQNDLSSSETNEQIEVEENNADEPIIIDTSSIIGQAETEDTPTDTMNVDLPTNTSTTSNEEIIQDYNIQSSAAVTEELLTEESTNTNNDFTPVDTQSNETVMEEVSESEEIQGETGPGLWVSVIVASILSYAYARRDERQLG